MVEFIEPDWPAPANVHAASTTRVGGVSQEPYNSFNLADHVADSVSDVATNRTMLRTSLQLPGEPFWLTQVHEAQVVEAGGDDNRADASWSGTAGQVCAVMTADCLPVLLCDRQGTRVSAVHAGWRGLHAGVIEGALAGFEAPEDVLVWLGPAIGPDAFEVGSEVVEAFIGKMPEHRDAFEQRDAEHWLCDIYRLARNVLTDAGVTSIYGGDRCTFSESERFFSYRREGTTGRMSSLIWLS